MNILERYREKLDCSVPQVDVVFPACMSGALEVLSAQGVDAYLSGASAICRLGRGQELVLLFLEHMPSVAKVVGEPVIPEVVETAMMLSRTANGGAINPFLANLPTCARRLEEQELMTEFLRLIARVASEAREGLVPFLRQAETLLAQLTVDGLTRWVEEGIRGYKNQPHRFPDYFSLQSADSKAALQRERHGTLYVDQERRLEQYLRAFWDLEVDCHPFSSAHLPLRKPVPFIDGRGFHIPDVCDDSNSIRGIDRYRALLAHLAAHLAFTQPLIADNLSPVQQIVIETFEDARVEALAIRKYPGLRRLWLALHPQPEEDACPEGYSCIRHKLAMLSRAILDPDHPYTDPLLLEYVERFHACMEADPYDTGLSRKLGVAYLTALRTPAFQGHRIWFKDTEVSYRDDNRYLWIFLEDTDDEDDFHSDHAVSNPQEQGVDDQTLFVRHMKEWDYKEQRDKPDWVTVYEAIQPAGDPAVIDALLEKHKLLAKRLKRIVDLLKPQQSVRIRYQEDGDELDLDVAIRSMVDYRAGKNPDPRIHMSRRTNGRDIAVMLLLDLSQSVNEVPEGCETTILQLSQEAVSLLSWAISELGDGFAIAGFASNTRHEVRYLHFKGFGETWGDEAKARLAGMQGGLSTRMGAAIRTAGHYLNYRQNAKKLLLVLTDGEPHDVDVFDGEYLQQDAKKAVDELSAKGIGTYCITLDPHADDYVADIFGPGKFTVIDHIGRLPERLPQLFMALTKG